MLNGSLSFSVTGETNLRTALLTGYNTHVRPMSVTEIQVAFNILSIQKMNIQEQQMAFSGWFTLVWNDPRLAWNESDYSDVDSLHTDSSDIWFPVMVIDNSVDDLSPIEDSNIPMHVLSDGTVRWAPTSIVAVNCDMDPTFFPFDSHNCDIHVTSFGYTMDELNLTVKGDGMVTDFYETNGEWKLVSHSAKSVAFNHDGHPYSRVMLSVSMTRLPNYHGVNLLLPVILNSILVPFVFKVSQESGEKMGFTLTILLSYMVVLTLLASAVPSTSIYTAVLEVYVSVVLVLSLAATVLTVYNQTIYFWPGDKPVHKWLNTSATLMSRFICKKQSHVKETPKSVNEDPSTIKSPTCWDSPTSFSNDGKLSGKEVAEIVDEFFFGLFFFIISVLTVIVLILLIVHY